MLGWKKHKLESRLPGEISITSDMQMTPPLWQRTMYNCFINAAVTPEGQTLDRIWTSLDVFPTTLASLGFKIEGNRLGLGVNMFSGEPTLAESMGFAELNAEMNKFSEFYLMNFQYGSEKDD